MALSTSTSLDATMRSLWTAAFFTVMSCRASTSDWDSVKAEIRSEFPEVEQISTGELKAHLDSPRPILLDVRTAEEYRVSHLPGAIRVEPGGSLPEELRNLDPEALVVAYCSVGYRSSRLVELLEKEGFTNAKNLEGSIFEWANKGYPLERDEESVLEVHPYDEEWGRLLDPSLHAYRPGVKSVPH
jgi:rhodanese-related sulfurtransferase